VGNDMKLNRVLSITMLSMVLISLVSIAFVYAQGQQGMEPPKQTNVGGNRYQGSIAGNETNQFRFQNNFQFQLRTNQSAQIDCDVDTANVQNRNFTMSLNTTQQIRLEMQIRASNNDLNATDGAQVRAQNQARFRFQERFMVNMSVNCTEGLHARLEITTQSEECTWAYYDEESEEFVPVDSEYEDGILSTETDHFSIWIVLTPEETPGIPGFPIYLLMGASAIGLIAVARKLRR